MAAGDNFSLKPNVVEPQEPAYNNIATQSESMKKEYLNLAATPEEKFLLRFKALTSTNMSILLTHFKDNSGGFYPFSWTSVPSYINSGSDMTGRWVQGSLKITPNGNRYWQCEVMFEKSV
jgi:hypothetical protein